MSVSRIIYRLLLTALEEAPTFGRGSSREKARMRVYNMLPVRGDEWPSPVPVFTLAGGLGACAPKYNLTFSLEEPRPLVGVLHAAVPLQTIYEVINIQH
jgi:hypothetical protein